MRIFDAEAILLDVVDLQERDRIVTFLTADHGKKKGVARGSRTKYSRFAGLLQPLAKVKLQWVEKEGRDLVRLGEVDLVRPAAALQATLEGILLGAYLAEHMVEFAQEDEPSDRLYRLLDSTLDALLAGVDGWLAARYFEIWVLRLTGIFPVPELCPLCGDSLGDRALLLEADAALVCPRCAGSVEEGEVGEGGVAGHRIVGADELELLRRTAKTRLRDLDLPPPPVLRRVEDLCARIRRQFLQRELKSYHVMRKTLNSL